MDYYYDISIAPETTRTKEPKHKKQASQKDTHKNTTPPRDKTQEDRD